MFLCKLVLALLVLSKNVQPQEDETENISTELHLADYDLLDAYDEVAQTTKNVLMGLQGYKEKIRVELERGTLLRQQYENNIAFESKVPIELMRNWTLLTKTGDYLLQEADFTKLVEFQNANEELVTQTKINGGIAKQDYEDILATKSSDPYELSKIWELRQSIFLESSHQFGEILGLVNKAYTINGEHSSMAYWEMLCEYEEGYNKAKALWNEILPLYKKLHGFVKTRLYKHYGISSNSDLIPVYLLGNNFGNDWSKIASIVLPHPYLYTEVNLELKYQTVEEIFQSAEKTLQKLGLKTPQPFYMDSVFNFTSCEHNIFTHCASSKSELITCAKLTWNEYLKTYESLMDVALRAADYVAFPRLQTRYSAVDEAIKCLGSTLFGIDDLTTNRIIDNNKLFNRSNASLLLIALEILPKLSYYIVADTWRLDELKFSYGNYTERWWKHRNGVQGVQGVTGSEPDYLGDPYIVGNKPYLSKFLGLLLQFQIMDYYEKYFKTDTETLADAITRDDNFRKFIADRPNKNWPELLSAYYGINEVSADALLQYFKPLEAYLEEAPLEQVIIPVTSHKHVSTSVNNITANNTYGKTEELIDEPKQYVNMLLDVSKSNGEAIGFFATILGLIVVSVLILVVVRKLKRKQKFVTNRRL